MAELKYREYVIDVRTNQSVFEQITVPQVNIFGERDLNGIPFTMNWSLLTQPFVMVDNTHSHDFNQVICFLGGDVNDVSSFDAEIEMHFGVEKEKRLINSPSVICIPAGLAHGPLIIRTVNKPVMYMDFPLAPKYEIKEKYG